MAKKKPMQKKLILKKRTKKEMENGITGGMRKEDGANARYIRSRCCQAPWIIVTTGGAAEARCAMCSKGTGPRVHIHIEGDTSKCDCCKKESTDDEHIQVIRKPLKREDATEIRVAARVKIDDSRSGVGDGGKLIIEGGIEGGGDKTMMFALLGLVEHLKTEILVKMHEQDKHSKDDDDEDDD